MSSHGASSGAAVTPWMSASAIVAKAAYGSHVLKIDGYSRTKELSIGKFITSRSFQVGGHRWCLRYYPHGHDPMYYGRYISIVPCLDPSEVGEVRAKYKISLLDNEGNPVPSYVRESSTCLTLFGKREPPASGSYHLITIEDLEYECYLKDDAFSVRCDITVVMDIVTEDVVVPAIERGVKKEMFYAPACCSIVR